MCTQGGGSPAACGVDSRRGSWKVTGAGRRPVRAPAVALDGAAGLDLGAGGLGQGFGAGVVDQAQARAAAAALRRLLDRRRAQRPCAARRVRACRWRGQLRRRGRLLHRGRQPDRQQPLAQVGARLVEQRARGQRRLVAAARALARPAAAQIPRHRVSAARAAEPFPPALLEKRPPASVLRRIHLHEAHQRHRVTHDHSSLETVCTREDREPTGRKGMVSY